MERESFIRPSSSKNGFSMKEKMRATFLYKCTLSREKKKRKKNSLQLSIKVNGTLTFIVNTRVMNDHSVFIFS